MKKKKALRNASLIALSAVMVCGAALGATACGKGGSSLKDDPNKLVVSIFCNASDAATNQQICNTWAAEYGKKIGKEIKVELQYNIDRNEYYNDLTDVWKNPTNSNVADIIYLAPRYVKAYAEKGRIVDLSQYIGEVENGVENIQRLWPNSVNYYGYVKGNTNYTMGQSIAYNPNGANGAGFYTVNGADKVGLYALPKDFSNFSTGYNKRFFTEDLKTAYTTTLATAERKAGDGEVKGPQSETGSVTPNRRYTSNSGSGYSGQTATGFGSAKSVVVYAASGKYTNPVTGDEMTATAGEPAPLINIGVPTTYYPFNFFRFNNFTEALNGGDPMANMCWQFTDGKGYTVTIPGFPGDTFEMPESYRDANAQYDNTIGHVTFTYAEYSALIWAMTYYLNTFPWADPNQEFSGIQATVGQNTAYYTVFGGEQYEGADGSPLYLLPWLYSNDANLIDVTSRYCTQCKSSAANPISEEANTINIEDPANWKAYAGTDTDKVTRNSILGGTIERDVQYGMNSQNFIETYGAFLALSSDWNGNPMGDIDGTNRNTNGWGYFRAGRSIFYGAGSWDAATRNDVDTDYLQFGQMPTPIAEKYALYSNIKGANYEMVEYSNDPTDVETATSFGDKQRADKSAGKVVYDNAQIIANQAKRQDKWAARMDSVGYAVTDKESILKGTYSEASEWKRAGAVSLAMALTAEDNAQLTLTYGGAQLPNFMDQCDEFANYQDYGADGAFKDMITPEGFATTQYYNEDGSVNASEAAKAEKIWNAYYALAREMSSTVRAGQAGSQTVGQFIANYQSSKWASNDTAVVGTEIKYDKQYENLPLAQIRPATDTNGLSFAMKILRMVYFTRADRDLNIRMQCGLNAVRDSSMYTFDADWMGALDARTASGLSTMLAYNAQKVDSNYCSLAMIGTADKPGLINRNPATYSAGRMTPAVFCFRVAKTAHSELLEAIQQEATALR